jgi:uncharacterized LabA/DUF88 family protein
MNPQFAILFDGGFVRRVLEHRNNRFPTAHDIEGEVQRISQHAATRGHDLLRAYYYDAPPATGKTPPNPIDRSVVDLGQTAISSQATSLFDSLELCPNFALRMGETVARGWTIGNRALKNLQQAPRALAANDFVPKIEQKGVDLRIGLDIARLALRDLVRLVVVVTGDSDLVPAFKFARREGVRVCLDHLGHTVRRELKAHVDIVL